MNGTLPSPGAAKHRHWLEEQLLPRAESMSLGRHANQLVW